MGAVIKYNRQRDFIRRFLKRLLMVRQRLGAGSAARDRG